MSSILIATLQFATAMFFIGAAAWNKRLSGAARSAMLGVALLAMLVGVLSVRFGAVDLAARQNVIEQARAEIEHLSRELKDGQADAARLQQIKGQLDALGQRLGKMSLDRATHSTN